MLIYVGQIRKIDFSGCGVENSKGNNIFEEMNSNQMVYVINFSSTKLRVYRSPFLNSGFKQNIGEDSFFARVK